MPNYVTNILSFEDVDDDRVNEILEAIKNDDLGIGSIDFNKIIPMPDYIFRGNLGTKEWELYGEDNWRDWSIKNWGSKWNACYEAGCYYDEGNLIEFETAWSAALPVVKVLSEKYPDAEIEISWSESAGSNVGKRIYQNGKVIYSNEPEDESKEAYELAADIFGYNLDKMGYKLSEDGTTYKFK